ncbi:MAG: DNA polymerase I [Verrucomicrobia bacterium]|nr:DNA polymerase I [Verrucomicrobiota bacterium]
MTRLFLLDGMALIYRAHFALIRSPIFTSRGFNTSAVFGFTNTLLDIIEKHRPTHLGVAFDTSAPTARHTAFPAYKAQREEMPEELSAALPFVKSILEAFHIPILTLDGYEADDIIGTLARRAEETDPFAEIYMVTPDKDFAQLVTARTKIFKPGRQGSEVEILGVPEIKAAWEVSSPLQVIDILGLWGDASDNIPGVPGVGEKTAKKLIGEYGSIESLLAATDQLKGKLQESLRTHADQARLCKELATIDLEVPLDRVVLALQGGKTAPNLLQADGKLHLEPLELASRDEDALKSLFVQLEFNALGKRLFGPEFKAGRGHLQPLAPGDTPASSPMEARLETLDTTEHHYTHILATDAAGRAALIASLEPLPAFCFDVETSGLDPKNAQLLGLALSWEKGTGHYVQFPTDPVAARAMLGEFHGLFLKEGVEKIGHNLKFDLLVLRWHGLRAAGPFFDTMLAHTLVEPEQRHTMDFISEALLGYTPVSIKSLLGDRNQPGGQLSMLDIFDHRAEDIAAYAAEDADVTWQIAELLRPMLPDKGQERVFYEIECPLLPVLVDLEFEGIAIDTDALAEFSKVLRDEMLRLGNLIEKDAGRPFNLNSPVQLGQILFDELNLLDKTKKTKTGQHKTDEATLQTLVGLHPIVEHILGYRRAAKLKSTYVDALPLAVHRGSGRIHTQFDQLMTATGRLASNNPNLQNIPIRTEMGREIRKAFVPRGPDYLILSADYSQVELRVMAALCGDPAMKEAFAQNLDIHTATAARVHGLSPEEVPPELRAQAKMVNFGIIYGITAFGLSQRLRIPKEEAAAIIDGYFRQYPGVHAYMERCIASARERGYVETLTGRRRYLRDIDSRNWTIRQAAERTAINTPVQGTAADMIKLAMIKVQDALLRRGLRTRMLLQVHDELVFDLHREEQGEAVPLVVEAMQTALPLDGVPIVVEAGVGGNWLEAH